MAAKLCWKPIGRPGFAGQKRDKLVAHWDETYGQGNWKIMHEVQGQYYDWLDALIQFYEQAYYVFLQQHEDILNWLCSIASDVYDSNVTNVHSGLDYNIQEGTSNHMQDIAIRRVVQRLGRKFEGSELLQIRGWRSKGARLSPGVVPFHEPTWILQPELQSWWKPHTVESFWQSNKIMLVQQPFSQENEA